MNCNKLCDKYKKILIKKHNFKNKKDFLRPMHGCRYRCKQNPSCPSGGYPFCMLPGPKLVPDLLIRWVYMHHINVQSFTHFVETYSIAILDLLDVRTFSVQKQTLISRKK